jgi:hypothetical protein
MKFKNTTSNSIILINEQTAFNLKSVTETATVYSIEFQVDLNEAAKRNNAFGGKIYFSKVAKQTPQPIFSKDRNGDIANLIPQQPKQRNLDGTQNLSIGNDISIGNQTLIDEIRNISTNKKQVIQRNDQNILKTVNFSLYDYASRESIEKAKANNYSREEKILTSTVVADIKNQPVFERLPVGQPESAGRIGQLSQTLTNETITREMRGAIVQNTDPASLIRKTGGIVSAVRSLGGVSTTPQTIPVGAIASPIGLIQQTLTAPTSLTKDSPISSTSFLTKTATITTSRVVVTLDFTIDTSVLAGVSTIYFEIEMFDDAARPIYGKYISINHGKNLDDFLTPKFAPEITSFYRRGSDGKIVLFLKQIDPKATFILLYYKEFLNDNDYTQPYTFLGKIPITKEQNEIKVDVSKTLNKRTIIRAIASSIEERKGLLFNSVTVPPTTNSIVDTTLITDPIVIWNYGFNADNTLAIDGIVQFRDAVSIKITRKQNDDTIDENTIFGPSFLNGSINFSLTDRNLSPGKTYIYNAYISSRDGIVRKALDNLIVFNPEIKNNQITTQILNANNSITGNNLNVTFDLRSDLNRENSAFILENFKLQGIYDLYRNIFEVTDTANSFAYKVLRKNLTTGEEEDFGILQSPLFNDGFLRANKNVKPLQPGYSYKYSVYTFLRTADSLLPQLQVTGSYNNKTYTYRPYFSRNPFVLREGTMVTEISLREQHTNSQYTFGPTGQVVEHNADFSNVLPIVKDVIATNKNRTLNILQWKVEGNLDRVDHFIILTQQLSARKVVGTIHNVSETNTFNFYDILTDGESGNLEYIIIPVYFDLVLGQEVKSNTIII